MIHASGMGGISGLKPEDLQALSVLNPDSQGLRMIEAHSDSESIRQLAGRLYNQRQRPSDKESIAKFELERETGLIEVLIYDGQTGHVAAKLKPEELVESLQSLENTGDNDAPLSSFFIEIEC